MSNISKINGLSISAADAQYIAGGNVDGAVPLATSAETASYIDPTFISASAAASGFGSGGAVAATSSWAVNAITASIALGVSSSIVTDTSDYRVAMFAADNRALVRTSGINISYTPNPGRLSVPHITATSLTGSLQGTASWATNVTSSSFASTASYLNNLNQNLTITGNLNVIGSASYTYVSASTLDVGTNTISVNVAEPAQRFGGLIVYDSGSLSHQATSSFLWDSEKNKWIYQNVSGAGYDGGMAMFGPRNTAGLGNEQGTTNNALMKGQGGDHITSSRIFDDGTNVYTNSDVQITGSLTVTGNVNATASNAILATSASVLYGTDGVYNLVYVKNSPGGNQLFMHPSSNIGRIDTNTGHVQFTAMTASFITSSFSGNLAGTASFATQALTASYALNGGGGGGGSGTVSLIVAGPGISVQDGSGPTVTINATQQTNLGLTYAIAMGYLMP